MSAKLAANCYYKEHSTILSPGHNLIRQTLQEGHYGASELCGEDRLEEGKDNRTVRTSVKQFKIREIRDGDHLKNKNGEKNKRIKGGRIRIL